MFPSAAELECTWWNVVKLGKSLYREGPGMDVNRPSQVRGFFVVIVVVVVVVVVVDVVDVVKQ